MLIGYARVSTEDQTTSLQTDALKSAGCKKIFGEKASGASTERPQLARLLDNIREGDVLVVWRLDRLGRNLSHLIETVQRLVDSKIGFRSLSESLDTTTSGGRFIFNVFGSLAQFERDIISERTRAGLAAARARGRFGGRKKKITPDKLKTARTLLRDPEHTLKGAAAAVGVHYVTLWRALKRADIVDLQQSKIAMGSDRLIKPRKHARPIRKKHRL
jgi:DNA invertase Pin-like site-specific DNA recombinase